MSFQSHPTSNAKNASSVSSSTASKKPSTSTSTVYSSISNPGDKQHSVWFVFDQSEASQAISATYDSCKSTYTNISYSSIDINNELYHSMLVSLKVTTAPTFLFWNRSVLNQTLTNPTSVQLTDAISGWN